MINKIIQTEEEYQQALSDLELLMAAAPGSKEEQQLELLSLLIEKYEEDHFPIPYPDPIEAIKFRMEQEGLTRKDLIPFIGSQSKVSEVLNRRRPLSITMIRNLHEGLSIPAAVLIQEVGGGPAKQSNCTRQTIQAVSDSTITIDPTLFVNIINLSGEYYW